MLFSLPNLMSLLFTMTMIIYGLLIVFAYAENKYRIKSGYTSYNLYFLVCIVMSIWAFGSAVSISAPSKSAAMFWSCVGAIGFSMIFSIVFHFSLYITHTDLLKSKPWIKIFIYIPAIFNILVFVVPGFPFGQECVFVKNQWGYIRKPGLSIIEFIYFGNYLIFVSACVIMIRRWIKKLPDKSIKSQAKSISLALVIALILIVLNDFVGVFFLKERLPNFAPVFILIPTGVVLYNFEKKSFIRLGSYGTGDILRSEMKDMIIKYMPITFLLGGFFAGFIEHTLGGEDISTALILGAIVTMVGVSFTVVLKAEIPVVMKDNIICSFISLFVVFLLFFSLLKGTGTVWPVPFIFIIAFMLYNNSRMIIGISITAISSYIVIGLIVPVHEISLTWVDHYLRLLISFFIIALAITVNRLYINKLHENKQQLIYQEMITTISKLLARMSIDDFDDCIDNALRVLGKHFSVDRTYYFSVDEEQGVMNNLKEWTAIGVEAQADSLQNIPIEAFPWWINQLIINGYLSINNINELPEEASAEKAELLREHIKSILVVALMRDQKLIGYIGFDAVKDYMKWDGLQISTLRVIGNVMADAIVRYEAEQKVHELAYTDYLTGLPNRAFFFNFLEKAIQLAKRHQTGIGVGLLDLDGFKYINDYYGHEQGDKLLVEVANRLKEDIRSSDMICRFGGDEFLILFSDVDDLDSLNLIGEVIINKFSHVFQIDDDEYKITASLGLSRCCNEDNDIKKIIRCADKAMYVAKSNGKNQYVVSEELVKLHHKNC